MERIDLSCYRLCLRTFSDRLYYRKSAQDRYPQNMEAGMLEPPMHFVPLEKKQEHLTFAGRLPEMRTGYCDCAEWFTEIP